MIFQNNLSSLDEDSLSKHTRSKEYIENIKMIRLQEEEKSRMIKRFIPRPSFAKWFKAHQIKTKRKSRMDRSNSDSDDYYDSDEEMKIREQAEPKIKMGRLSTVKEVSKFGIISSNTIFEPRKHSQEEKLKEVIEETDSDMREETPLLTANRSKRAHRFSKASKQKLELKNRTPPLILTKSIELLPTKSKNVDLRPLENRNMRNLFTP